MTIHDIYGRISPYFRKKRTELFLKILTPTEQTRILDVGGYPWVWLSTGISSDITLLNPHIPAGARQFGPQFKFVFGDGTKLPYLDHSFDILYSNSVIEHLGSYENQKRFAREARRVGNKLWIQTPSKHYFLEPHLMAPFVHYLPRSIQRKLIRYFTVWGLMTKPSKKQIEEFLNEIRLIGYQEFHDLFPDCQIYREKTFGFTKSFIAVRT